MGIYYRGVVAVGVQRGSIENFDKFEDLIDEGDLEVISPSYDGSSEDDAVVGLTYAASADYSSTRFVWNQQEIDELKAKFLSLTGMEAKVWLTPYGH